MRLKQAINSKNPFKRVGSDEYSQWFEGGSGPFTHLIGCDYFVHGDEVSATFSTSIDLYKSDIDAYDWEVYEDMEFRSFLTDSTKYVKLVKKETTP
jgi:hypothetical protein